MEEHEKHCTLNPNRECRMCGLNPGKLITYIEKYKDSSNYQNNGELDESYILGEFQVDTDGCPACILTIIRCCGLLIHKFDYQEAVKEWWEKKNNENLYDYY